MTTSARLVDEITGESIWLSRDESDPLWCCSPIATESIDLGFAAPRTVINNIPNANGTTDLTEYFAGRTVAWSGWIVPTDGDPFPAITWDSIRKLTAPTRRPWLYVSEDGWENERRMVLRGDSLSSPLDRRYGPVIVAQLTWVCPAGVLESTVRHQQIILQSGGTGGLCITPSPSGYCFAPTCGNSFAAGDFGGATLIYNIGTVVTYPTITFIGPSKNPRLINLRTQQGIYLNTTLAPNQQVIIDCLHKTANETAQPPINRLGWYDYTRSTWLTLSPGDTEFSYVSDNRQGVCQVGWRDRWI